MGKFKQSAVALRIFGEDLDPDLMTAMLGCAPSVSRRTGEIVHYASGREQIIKCGKWHLEAERAEPENLDTQIRWILSQMTDNLSVWKSLIERYDVDMFCGLFMAESNDGFSLSPDVLLMLGQRGIEIDFDVYDPDDDDPSDGNLASDPDKQ